MTVNFKDTYKSAAISALYICLFIFVSLLVYLIFFTHLPSKKYFLPLSFFIIITYFFVFFVLQFRTKKFIFSKVKKLYNEIASLDSNSNFKSKSSTSLSEITYQIHQYASDRKQQISDLNEREVYRREFLGNVSHELKTPLFTVQGYIETLIGGAMKDKELRKKYLGRASKGVERLVSIVNDLDLISKSEVGELALNIESFNVIELIQSVFDLLEMKADQKNIILMFDKKHIHPIYIKADKEKIQQLFTNLITNSIKYGKENGTTEVSIEDWKKNTILVKVIDDGEGIKQQNIPRLFERFFRVDKSGARSEGGSGLGLSIVKHIIEAHEEEIYVESEFGKGSTFAVTLEKAE
jgi:two-component system, OmpR family, phosphate regulon sensor histidine kinase PhoR